MSRLTYDELTQLDELQARYIQALDAKKMNGWLDCFAEQEDASYICISSDNVERGLKVAMMLDDCRDRLIDRCTFVEKIWAGTFQDYRTRHFVQRVQARRVGGANVSMVSHFSVLCTPDDPGTTELLASGVYEDAVLLDADKAFLLSRRVVMDTALLPRYLVFPL